MTTKHKAKPRSSKEDFGKREHDRTFHLANLVDSISDALISTDLEFNVLEWNAAAESLYGWSSAEVIGRPLSDFTHSEYTDTTRAEAIKTVQQSGIWKGKVTQQRKDGTRFSVMTSVSHVIDPTGKPIGFVAINHEISEGKRADETIAWLASFPERNPNPVVEIDSSGVVFYMNPAAQHNFPDIQTQGFKHPWLTGLDEIIARFQQEGTTEFQREIQIGDAWYSQTMHYVHESARLRVYSAEITEQVQAKRQTLQMKRLYATLSQVNQTIVRVQNREELYQSICDVALKFGELALAWIGLLDEATGDVQPVTAVGMDISQWPFPIINIGHGFYQNGVIAEALKTSNVVTSEDVQTDERTQTLHGLVQEFGFRSLASVPFRHRGKTIGALNLISVEPGVFKAEEERKLLEEMGLDISFALDTMENEKERRQVQEELRRNEHVLRLFVQNSPAAIAMFDRNMKYIVASRRYLIDYQLGGQDIVGRSHYEVFPEVPERRREIHRRCLVGAIEKAEEDPFPRANGKLDWVRWEIHPWYETDGEVGGIILFSEVITERKEAEKELKESEERFSTAFHLSPVPHAILTAATSEIMAVNDASCKLFGYGREELIGNTAARLHLWEDLRQREAALEELRTTGHVHSRETTIQTRSGEKRNILLSIEPILWKGVPSLISSTLDITERKQAEEELREAREIFQKTFDSSPIAIALSRLSDRVIVDVNAAMEKLLGYTRAELVGKPVANIDYWADLQERQRALEILLREGALRNYEFSFKTKSGTIGQALNYTEVFEQRGDTYLLSTFVDITERKQAEKDVQQRTEDLLLINTLNDAANRGEDFNSIIEGFTRAARLTLNCNAAAIYLLSADGSHIEMQSSTLPPELTERIEKLVGRSIPKISIPLTEGGYFRQILANERGTITSDPQLIQRWIAEFTYTTFLPDFLRGPIRKLVPQIQKILPIGSTITVPLISSGQTIGLLDVSGVGKFSEEDLSRIRNISPQVTAVILRKRAEEEIQRVNAELEQRVIERTAELKRTNLELDRANHAKDEFLATMSHELRTPLNSILGLSESLLEQRGGSLNDYQQRSLQIIEASGDHLLTLINDILDLSKIEAGKFDFYPQPMLVEELCKSSLAFIKAQAAKKSITVTYTNESVVPEIFADPRRLKQILVNLLTNAVKFTPQNGEVTLRVDADLKQNLIQFSVIDTGVGIAPKDLQRLFQPFVQLESSLNRQYEGTGLGLALVQRLTDFHGGSVEVESEVGIGSRFTINLPCKQETEAQLRNLEPSDESLTTKLEEPILPKEEQMDRGIILLTEDNPANTITIGEYLESYGYSVVYAHDGLEAIKKAEASRPAVILMDIQMPVMDGLEAIRRLRANPHFAATPIIALTALAMPGDRERCLEVGATEYFSKPVSLKTLRKKIGDLLHNHPGS